MKRNEMVISIYDDMFCYGVKMNGHPLTEAYTICLECSNIKFDENRTNNIINFMKKYNVHHLIICEDGGIEIYDRWV